MCTCICECLSTSSHAGTARCSRLTLYISCPSPGINHFPKDLSFFFLENAIRNQDLGDFPGGPVVKTSPSSARCVGLIPGQGVKTPHASRPKNQNINQKQYCNKFSKDFKNGPHQKKFLKKEIKI